MKARREAGILQPTVPALEPHLPPWPGLQAWAPGASPSPSISHVAGWGMEQALRTALPSLPITLTSWGLLRCFEEQEEKFFPQGKNAPTLQVKCKLLGPLRIPANTPRSPWSSQLHQIRHPAQSLMLKGLKTLSAKFKAWHMALVLKPIFLVIQELLSHCNFFPRFY